jgi:predicted Zn finger-like uncharacterized protein
MEPFVTRCPLCDTAFRVTGKDMQIAQGLVRCGACTHVFHADNERLGAAFDSSDAAEISEAYIHSLFEDALTESGTGLAPIDADNELLIDAGLDAETAADAEITADASVLMQADTAEDAMATDEREQAAAMATLPVEMERGPAPRRLTLGRVALASACVLATLALVVQYAWFERTTLLRDARWRPWYERGCALLQCTLPTLRDISLIGSESLSVRPAPGHSRMLLVDAVLTNHATFEQPLPGLELRFSDINGQLVAQRVFTPREYLTDSTHANAHMRSRESVRVGFQLVDPGRHAVNYQLHLRDL